MADDDQRLDSIDAVLKRIQDKLSRARREERERLEQYRTWKEVKEEGKVKHVSLSRKEVYARHLRAQGAVIAYMEVLQALRALRKSIEERPKVSATARVAQAQEVHHE